MRGCTTAPGLLSTLRLSTTQSPVSMVNLVRPLNELPRLMSKSNSSLGSLEKESAEFTIRMLAGHAVRAERATGEKTTRWAPFAAQCEAGNVKLVRGLWNHAFLEEAALAPNGAHDDQIDAAALAFNKLARPRRTFYVGVA